MNYSYYKQESGRISYCEDVTNTYLGSSSLCKYLHYVYDRTITNAPAIENGPSEEIKMTEDNVDEVKELRLNQVAKIDNVEPWIIKDQMLHKYESISEFSLQRKLYDREKCKYEKAIKQLDVDIERLKDDRILRMDFDKRKEEHKAKWVQAQKRFDIEKLDPEYSNKILDDYDAYLKAAQTFLNNSGLFVFVTTQEIMSKTNLLGCVSSSMTKSKQTLKTIEDMKTKMGIKELNDLNINYDADVDLKKLAKTLDFESRKLTLLLKHIPDAATILNDILRAEGANKSMLKNPMIVNSKVDSQIKAIQDKVETSKNETADASEGKGSGWFAWIFGLKKTKIDDTVAIENSKEEDSKEDADPEDFTFANYITGKYKNNSNFRLTDMEMSNMGDTFEKSEENNPMH